MRSKTWSIVAIVVGLVLILVLPGLFMLGRFWMGGYGGMMSGPGMMNWGYGTVHPFAWILMGLGWLVPVGALVLLVAGVIGLVSGGSKPGNVAPPAPERKCASCGKSALTDWTTCPYCGNPLQ